MNDLMRHRYKHRFFRAWEVLEKHKKEFPGDMLDMIENDEISRMWIRNEANLWTDWISDKQYIIDGVDYNPGHPDNLSETVWQAFRIAYMWEVVLNNKAFAK